MPRSFKEVIEHAEELAAHLDKLDPDSADVRDAKALAELRQAVLDRAAAEARIAELVSTARQGGHSWSAIGAMLGTSGEAARQRYTDIAART
ncbi:MAG TPA: hypothetical protein VK988_08050 [Acidimicrobiales bacterium]|nr:hypothetical protein [Acidimicrobiales bacterium]